MQVVPVPCLSDNYAYLLVDSKTQQVTAVDPVDAPKVLSAVLSTGFPLTGILTTHHHADHSGGNTKMQNAIPGIPVYGGDERIPAMTHRVEHGDEFTLGSFRIRAIRTPGHTTGSVCYFVEEEGEGEEERAVFSGDTLFVGGCGRLFEGSAADMHESLNVRLAALPGDTRVYAGHEYTRANLRFALTVDPDNERLRRKAEWCAKVQCTMPSSIAEELETNPFMRVHRPELQKAAAEADPVRVLAAIRKMKDNF
ncbi:Cytoplasmic glyoxalase II [Kickxella alabastrina]|nr:Cytoplasmic glyoxalase II [Kickxella alabastrina]